MGKEGGGRKELFFFGEEVKGSIILPYIRVSYRLDCLLSETESTSSACPPQVSPSPPTSVPLSPIPQSWGYARHLVEVQKVVTALNVIYTPF